MNVEPPIPAEVLAAVRAPFAELGAAPIDPPVMQPLGLILDLSGEAMRERLILVQADGGGEAALRPDFTIPAARLHIDSGRPGGRYFYEGKAFRAAPRGRAAYEEFLQIGLEAFETGAAPEGDAEIGERRADGGQHLGGNLRLKVHRIRSTMARTVATSSERGAVTWPGRASR